MKKLLLLSSFIFLFIAANAQSYGDQSPLTINGITGLLHLPDTYLTEPLTTTHPLVVFFAGKGEYGSDPAGALKHGTGYAIFNNTWDGTAVNPLTSVTEKFIVFSCINPNNTSGPSFLTVDAIYTYLINHYRVDTTCMNATGLSRGGGTSLDYPDHISYSNCCPGVVAYTQPSHLLSATVSMSSEIWDGTPYINLLRDSVAIWGFSDDTTGGCDTHGPPIHHLLNGVIAAAPNLGAYTNYICNKNCGHECWDQFYASAYHKTINGISMNQYQFFLYHRRGAAPPPPTNTITIGTITNTSFCVTLTAGQTFSVPFTSTGPFQGDNVYIVEMSGPGGGFANYKTIGQLPSALNSGTITAVVPPGTIAGALYKFRVVSGSPFVISTNVSPAKTVTLSGNSIAPVATQILNPNINGDTLKVTNLSAATAMQWYNGTTPITGATLNYFVPNFPAPGTYILSCKSTFGSCGTFTSNTDTVIVSSIPSTRTYLPKYGSTCGIYNWTKGNPGDTLVLDPTILGDTVCVLRFLGLTGTAAKHITVIADHGVIRNTGSLACLDCHFIDFNFGTQTNLPHAVGVTNGIPYDIPYGYESFGKDGSGGPGFEIRGKDSNITASNMYIHDKGRFGQSAGYGIIIKNDPLDYGCDFSYDYPNMIKNIKIWDVVEINITQDANYLGFSGGYNFNGQPVVCNGTTYYPRPTALGHIEFYNFFMKHIGRTGIQGGGLAGGNSKFHNINGYDLGWEINGAQGALIAIGTPDSSVEIFNCTSNRTWLSAVYTYNYGKFYLHDNNFDSSGYCVDTFGVLRTNGVVNVQIIPQFNIDSVPTQFVIKNNVLGKHGNPIAANIALYAGYSNNYASSGNQICNSGIVYHSGVTAPYDTCGSSPPDTICTTTSIQHDTTKIQQFFHVTARDSTHTDTLFHDTLNVHLKGYKYNIQKIVITTKTKTFHLLDTTYYDSVVHFVTPSHDTTICTISLIRSQRLPDIGMGIPLPLDPYPLKDIYLHKSSDADLKKRNYPTFIK